MALNRKPFAIEPDTYIHIHKRTSRAIWNFETGKMWVRGWNGWMLQTASIGFQNAGTLNEIINEFEANFIVLHIPNKSNGLSRSLSLCVSICVIAVFHYSLTIWPLTPPPSIPLHFNLFHSISIEFFSHSWCCHCKHAKSSMELNTNVFGQWAYGQHVYWTCESVSIHFTLITWNI